VSHQTPKPFDVEWVGDATVVTFAGPKGPADSGDALYAMSADLASRRIVLNFEKVRVLTSAPISVLVNLQKKVEAPFGRLLHCLYGVLGRPELRVPNPRGLPCSFAC
jgi:hypothetical protein